MVATRKKDNEVEIAICGVQVGQADFNLVGTSPLIFNAPSEKAKHELLFPKGRMTAADKATNLKHDPIAEFRNSVYRRRQGEKGPTRLLFPAPGYKKSMASAALDLPGGATKSRIGRLTWVNGTYVDVYGLPQLSMTIVRMADANRTPDIRTRCILPEWAASITINYAATILKHTTITNLLAWAGIIVGVGDWRQEKGSASFGQFEQRSNDDPDFMRICRDGGMAAQDEALNADFPICYDSETENLLAWFLEERERRGKETTAPKKPARKRVKTENGDDTAPAVQ